MTEMYDVAILGAGPAGAAAAIYAARAGLKVLWLDKNYIPGGQMTDTGAVDNYPGMPGILGPDLGEAMAAHAEKLGISPERDAILTIEKMSDGYRLKSKKHEYEALTVICALGAKHRKLDIPGEEELSGAGVSYCATCDGAFFKDQTVAVIGGGNTACEDALTLAGVCRKVYLIHRRAELRADRAIQERLHGTANIEILWNRVPLAIDGEEKVTALQLKDTVTGEESSLALDGVFVAVGMLPNSELLQDLCDLDPSGYAIAGEDCETSAAGLYAAGDLRTKKVRQIVTAVADGACAVRSALEYLQKRG